MANLPAQPPPRIDFGQTHLFAPVHVIDAPEKKTWVGRHVEWIRQERAGVSKIAVGAFAVFEGLVLALSLVGLPILIKEIKEWRRQEAKNEYFERAGRATPPGAGETLSLKSKTRTFNHAQEFAIQDGFLWMRRRNTAAAWEPIYFDGYGRGKRPAGIDCDGANLIVLDEENTVYYKKVLKELRNRADRRDIAAADEQKLLQSSHITQNDPSVPYIAVDKGGRDNWKEEWFTLPFLRMIVNAWAGKRLTLPASMRAWAISQRGRYSDYLEDQANRPHISNVGVTTLYVLDERGKDLYKYDPWSPKFLKIGIPLPETRTSTFEALNISVCASTIMAIGYEDTEANPPKDAQLKIYTRLADIDSEGWNPGLKYDYFDTHQPQEDVIVVPIEGSKKRPGMTAGWLEHDLPGGRGDRVTGHITLVQAGAGNDAKEMRIEGERDGKRGFFFKKIKQQVWEFEPFGKGVRRETPPLLLEPRRAGKNFESSVHHYKSDACVGIGEGATAMLYDFGERSFHSRLVVKIKGREYTLNLHKKRTLRNFVGSSRFGYDLVIPPEYHNDPELLRVFGGKTIVPLNCRQEGGRVILEGPFGTPLKATSEFFHHLLGRAFPIILTFSRGKGQAR